MCDLRGQGKRFDEAVSESASTRRQNKLHNQMKLVLRLYKINHRDLI